MIRQGRAARGIGARAMGLTLVAALGGCATYHARPLDPGKVLGVPAPARIEARAASLEHPLLKPLKVDLADGLSPAEAEVVAVVMSPKLRAERDRLGLARAQLLEAGLLPDPVVAGGQDFPVGGNDQGTTPAWSAGLSLDLKAVITRGARAEAARHAARQVDLEVAWSEWQVAQAARLAVYRLAYARRSAALMGQVVGTLAADLGARQKALAQGLATQVEVAAAEGDLDDARETLASLEGQRATAEQTLDALLGLPPGHPVKLEGEVAPDWPPLPAVPALLAHLHDRLDLVALRQGYRSQEARVRLAVLSQIPDIGIGLTGAADTSNVITLGYGLTLSLPFLNGGRARVAVARATRKMLRDAYAARRFEARAEVVRLATELDALARQIAAARAGLPALERVARAYQKGLAAGDVDLVSAHAAARRVWQARVHLLALEAAVAARRVALTLAVGHPLRKDAR